MCNVLVWNSCGLISPPSSDLRHRILFVTNLQELIRENLQPIKYVLPPQCFFVSSSSVHHVWFAHYDYQCFISQQILIFIKKNHFTSKITYLVIIYVNILNVYFLLIALFTTHKVCGLFSQFSLKNEAHGE